MMGISANSTTQYLTSSNITGHSIIPVIGAADAVKFYYDNSTLQIRSLALNLCLDDGGQEALGGQNRGAVVTFQPCDSQSPNQQFILNSQSQILNPNWPNNKICLSANGNKYRGLILWDCLKGYANETFVKGLIYCPGDNRAPSWYIYALCRIAGYYIGGSSYSQCIQCPAGKSFSDLPLVLTFNQGPFPLMSTHTQHRRVLPVRMVVLPLFGQLT